jgi:hypothetical protein
LIATIRFHRPDLLKKYKKVSTRPIPLNPSLAFFHCKLKHHTFNLKEILMSLNLAGSIPDVGELMLASFPTTTTQFAKVLAVTSPWYYFN